jgi:hypothetical protein
MTPEDLFSALRTAYADGDDARIGALANAHAAEILEHYGSWLHVPPEIRADPTAVQAWVQPLILIARMFDGAGFPELLAQLEGGADNLPRRWQSVLARAQQLVAAGQYAQAVPLVEALLPELEGASGPLVDDMRPKAYALLGQARFEQGAQDAGAAMMQKALDDARRADDESGVRSYRSNLRVMQAFAAAEAPGDASAQHLLAVRAAIAGAQALSDEADFAGSNERLLALLADSDLAGVRAEFQGKLWGLLGLNYCALQDVDRARHYTELALQACRQAGDLDGVRIYAANAQHLATRTR